MLREGVQALSDAELLAVLLRTGTHKESAVTLAQRILKQAGGLKHIPEMSVAEMTKIKGIGEAKALQIDAGIELGRRLSQLTYGERPVIRSPRDAAALLMEELRYLQKEHFVSCFEYKKSCHRQGNALHGQLECIDRASARSVPCGDQTQQCFDHLRT